MEDGRKKSNVVQKIEPRFFQQPLSRVVPPFGVFLVTPARDKPQKMGRPVEKKSYPTP